MTKVLIATAAYSGSVTCEYAASLANTIIDGMQEGILFVPLFAPNLSLIQAVRNGFCKTFLDMGFDKLLWIDEDVSWWPSDAIAVVNRTEGCIGAPLPRKVNEKAYAIRHPGGKLEWSEDGALMKCEGLATGFMCCSRDMIQQMWDASDEYGADDGQKYRMIFEVKMVDGQFWGEDYLFCRKWREMGGDVWLSPLIKLNHVGKKVWQGDFSEWMSEQSNSIGCVTDGSSGGSDDGSERMDSPR